MTSRKELLTNIKPHKSKVALASGREIPVDGIVMSRLNLTLSTDQAVTVNIPNVLYVPKLKGGNLISESKLELSGCKIFSELGHRKVFQKVLNGCMQF